MNLKTVKKQFSRVQRNLKAVLEHPLTQRDKAGALKRYILFHILGRLLPGPALFPYAGNIKFLAQPGMAGIVGNIYMGLDDLEEQGFLLHLLRPDDLFVDVGANVGAYTLLASGVCGATSIAIEPIPDTFEHLMRNIRLNNLTNNVESYNMGAGSHQGSLLFTKNLDVLNQVVLENAPTAHQENTIRVEIFSLDDLLKDKTPLMLKIDVEGYEKEVITGALQILKMPSLRCIVIELSGYESRYGFSYEKVHVTLQEHSFAPYTYDPLNRSLQKIQQFNHHKSNTLYLRDIEWIGKRISEAPQITVLGQSF